MLSLRLGRDALCDALDAELGHTLGADKEVFSKHSSKYELEFFKDCEALGIRLDTYLVVSCRNYTCFECSLENPTS